MKYKIIIGVLTVLTMVLLLLLYMSSAKRKSVSNLKVSVFNQGGKNGLIIDHPNHSPFSQITTVNVDYSEPGKIRLEGYIVPFNVFNRKVIYTPWPILITENIYPGKAFQLEYWDEGYKQLAEIKIDENGQIILTEQ